MFLNGLSTTMVQQSGQCLRQLTQYFGNELGIFSCTGKARGSGAGGGGGAGGSGGSGRQSRGRGRGSGRMGNG